MNWKQLYTDYNLNMSKYVAFDSVLSIKKEAGYIDRPLFKQLKNEMQDQLALFEAIYEKEFGNDFSQEGMDKNCLGI